MRLGPATGCVNEEGGPRQERPLWSSHRAFDYIPTTAGDGTGLLSLTLDDPVNPTVATYATDFPDNADFALGPPVVTGVGEVPEPATWLPVGLILGGAWCRRRWWARR